MPITAAIVVPHPPLILPEVGRGQEEGIADTTRAYRAAIRFLVASAPQAVVLISPHATSYADYFHISPGAGAQGDFSRFGAGQLRVRARYGQSLAERIGREAQKRGLPAGSQGERERTLDHGSMIPLWFLQEAGDLPVVRMGPSGLPLLEHYRLGESIAAAVGDLPVAVIASADLSHKLKEEGPYGFAPEGPALDAMITGALASGAFGTLLEIDEGLRERGAECGLGAICLMAGALDGRQLDCHLLSYEGPFGVGYAVATLRPGAPDEARAFADAYEARQRAQAQKRRFQEDAYVRLARQAVEGYVRCRRSIPLPEGLPGELVTLRAGAFVSLHKHGALRGCIGTIAPTAGNLGEEIIQNAISAATADSRFDPVRPAELDSLAIKVDVLGEAEPIAGMEQLDPKKYGVIVSSGRRRGLLLPDLEGVDTAAQQVEIARRKAGIGPDEPIRLARFEVVRHT